MRVRVARGLQRRRDAKALDVDALLGDAGRLQRGLRLIVQRVGATDEGMVHALRVDQGAQEQANALRIQPPGAQRGVHLLAREHRVQGQAREVAVLQVFQLLLEHRGRRRAVAVQQRAAHPRRRGQQGAQDGQDGRDATAAGNGQHVRGAVGAGECSGGLAETALRLHDLQRVPGLELAMHPGGEDAPRHAAHAHAQRFARRRADGVGAAQVLAGNVVPQRQVLARREGEVARLPRGHLESDDHRIVGVRAHVLHAQGMEVKSAHGGFEKSRNEIEFCCKPFRSA